MVLAGRHAPHLGRPSRAPPSVRTPLTPSRQEHEEQVRGRPQQSHPRGCLCAESLPKARGAQLPVSWAGADTSHPFPSLVLFKPHKPRNLSSRKAKSHSRQRTHLTAGEGGAEHACTHTHTHTRLLSLSTLCPAKWGWLTHARTPRGHCHLCPKVHFGEARSLCKDCPLTAWPREAQGWAACPGLPLCPGPRTPARVAMAGLTGTRLLTLGWPASFLSGYLSCLIMAAGGRAVNVEELHACVCTSPLCPGGRDELGAWALTPAEPPFPTRFPPPPGG